MAGVLDTTMLLLRPVAARRAIGLVFWGAGKRRALYRGLLAKASPADRPREPCEKVGLNPPLHHELLELCYGFRRV